MKWFIGKWFAHALGGTIASVIVELFKSWKQGARYPLFRAWKYAREHRWVHVLLASFVALALFEAMGGSLEQGVSSLVHVALALVYGSAAAALYFWPVTLALLIAAVVLLARRV